MAALETKLEEEQGRTQHVMLAQHTAEAQLENVMKESSKQAKAREQQVSELEKRLASQDAALTELERVKTVEVELEQAVKKAQAQTTLV